MMRILGIAGIIAVLSIFFGLLEWKFGRQRRFLIWKRPQMGTDLAYWFLSPLVTDVLTRVALFIVILPVALLLGWKIVELKHYTGYGPISRLPLAAQTLMLLLMGDFISYWMHRYFHTGRLWKFHAVHHSPTHLDWLAAARVHPVNEILMRVVVVLPLFLLGFSALSAVYYVPIAGLYALLLHCDLPWTYGPLRYVIASPVFHRWHHSREAEAIDKNFAGFLPLWDLLFGTFYMPKGKLPEDLGVVGDPVPTTLWRQLVWPFKRGA